MRKREQIYNLALEYVEHCEGAISVDGFKAWINDKDIPNEDSKRIFLVALEIIKDNF